MNTKEIMEKLREPFPPEEIEFRVQSCGLTSNGKPWVMALAYVQARAIQNRLDDIFGFDGWQDEYRSIGDNMICHLSVKINDSWVYKENGASNTDVEAFKGGISGAFKRVAASGYGIGRYLYNLTESFAECTTEKPKNMNGWSKARTKDKKTTIYWKIPELPSWALPKDFKGNKSAKVESHVEKPQSHAEPHKQSNNTNTPVSNKNTSSGDVCCEDCGKKITEKVAMFSSSKYGKKLCMDCQKKESKAV